MMRRACVSESEGRFDLAEDRREKGALSCRLNVGISRKSCGNLKIVLPPSAERARTWKECEDK
eukprot:scaffold6643_cov114-Skeletonema_dohrnii-CCMP3373.AAC.1